MILPLAEANRWEAGGKARGLARLVELGMKVPRGVVLIPGEGDSWRSELEEYLQTALPGEVAVRSSALAEDGETASFAGQFESFLNCRTPEEISGAVEKCVGSADRDRAGSYREHFHMDKASFFPVVIQQMVRASRSGVIFTANPVNHRTDQWMISVTTGVGEKLMAGTADGEQVLLTRNGSVIEKGKLLDIDQIGAIYRGARKVAGHFKRPMDLEWAMDESGTLYWLQARPVTTLKKVHLNELDGSLFRENEVFTRANIGEMMPGPVTPLTYSVFGRAIEVGLQDFYIASGALKGFSDEWIYFRMFYNHLFFSMTRLVDISEAVLLNEKENVEFAIMGDMLGDTFGDYRPVRPKAFHTRLWNQVRQFRYLSSGVKRMKKLEALAETFSLKLSSDPMELYRELDRSLGVLNQAFAHHYCASSQSGSYQSAVMSILNGGKQRPNTGNYRDAAFLMSDLREVESADVVQSIDRLYEKYNGHEQVMRWSGTRGDQEESLLPPEFQKALSELIQKHGHRCVREGELREKCWEEEPEKLFSLIRKRFQAGDRADGNSGSYEGHRNQILSQLGWMKRRILSRILSPARAAVARREYTKSMTIRIQHKIKKGYMELTGIMVQEGLLGDTDQVFFLTHQELGRLLGTGDKEWSELAEERRRLFPQSFALKFPDHCQGYPEPLPQDAPGIKINGNAVKGLPVSAGSVEAKIRIVEKIEDADTLEQGEIMVCQYTDVGWTPYFSLAAGLITEIGSPLSHGAVVAREYGIPAVVNAKGALGFFKTGETVMLDGATGVVRKIS
ncbi:MAG: PEP/pyruvate-binding domain-containing protein [Bacteroidota bacterium]